MTTRPIRPQTTGGSDATAYLRLQGGWLAAGRAGWVAVAILTVGLTIGGIPGRFEQLLGFANANRLSLEQLSLPGPAYAGYILALDLVLVLAHLAVAALIFWRRSDERIALFVAFTLVTNGSVIPLSLMYAQVTLHPAWQFLLDGVIYLGLASSTSLLFFFPDGRFVPRWTGLLAFLWAALALLGIFFPNTPLSFPRWPLWLQVLGLLAFAGAGVFAQIYRYVNVSRPVQRQQTKWCVFGLTAAVVGPLAYFLPFVILPSVRLPVIPNIMRNLIGGSFFTFSLLSRMTTSTVFTLVVLLSPIFFAIAIFRYRLWDIDILIHRTLTYAVLTGTLALTYFASVVFLQALFGALTGQEQSPIVTVLSTLMIAALFVPLRRRVQEGIDRRFYRRKYDAAKVLAAFSATVRDETDLDRLTERLVAVVQETMQPEHVSLWLRPTADERRLTPAGSRRSAEATETER